MPHIFTNDGVHIAKVMKDHLNSWSKKPCEIMLEDLGKDTPSMMIQQLSAAEKRRSYVNGSYIGVWNFAVYIRVSGRDTAERLDATACLSELCIWLTSQSDDGLYISLPTIDDTRTPTKIEMTSTPALAARYEDGTEEYQVLLALEYKARRK